MNQEQSFTDRKEWAKSLYTRLEMSIRDTALTVGVEDAVVRQWINEGAWEGQKRSRLISKTTLLEHYYTQLEKVNGKLREEENADLKNLDAYTKYTALIKNLETEPTISTIIEVSELFIQWLRRKDPTLTRKMTVHFDAFIKYRIAA